MSRVPMIRFRYGVRSAIDTAVSAATTAATSAAAATTVAAAQVVYASKSQLPAKFRPRPISDEEEEAIRLGGASPYPAPKKK